MKGIGARATENKFLLPRNDHMKPTTDASSCVLCHVTRVMCHMSCVSCLLVANSVEMVKNNQRYPLQK